MNIFYKDMALRRIVSAALLLIVTVGCFGQPADKERAPHNVFLEFFGPASIIGASYDTRFPGSRVWGWRAGAGLSMAPLDEGLDYQPGVSVPLVVNGLFGRRASKFELGLIVAPGCYFYKNREYYHDVGEDYCYCCSVEVGPVKCRVGCSFGLDFGYRLQRRSGFAFRVGWSPSVFINSGGDYLNLYSLFPHIGFGYTFR